MAFTHLHVHSHYSLLDGGNRIAALVESARAHGMTALALTDHGNLFGAVDFHRQARAAGLKPILGMEAYIAPSSRHNRSSRNIGEASNHLLLLAMNERGWKNLMKLSSRAYLEGFYYRPRVDRELLAEHQEGLICTTACLGGEVPEAFVRGRDADARRIAGEYREIFGPDRFFVEIQNQGEADQDAANPKLIALARDLGVGLVGTNDVHFLRRADKRSHEVLTCISTNKRLTDPDILRYSAELYLKSPAEMEAALGAWPEALRNTERIAEMCDVDLRFGKHLPSFRAPDGADPDTHLRRLAWEGLARRFGEVEPPPAYRERLEWELRVIQEKGYSAYFLIVQDFVGFARKHRIPAAPRGSGVATLLGYALGIADVDPMRYGLLFERFTDPQRQEDPDVDIDVCQDGRARVLQYIRERYGHVAQIITYNVLKARAALRDVARVLGVPLDEVDRIARHVPDDPRITVEDALAQSPELRRMVEDPATPHVREMFEHAAAIEGLARHAGVHAGAVVICDEPLADLVPLYRAAETGDAITQWDYPTCERAGLMKMDLLGLRTLSIIQRARELVEAETGRDIDPETLPLDDPRIFALFRRGETDAVFQFESEGMKKVLLQMQPSRIEDLIAANAMYRPGPMELIETYCARKAGRQPVEPVHPRVDDILAETYGIMVYQEQVMQVLNRLGDLPLSEALTLIKAISKKRKDVIDAQRPAFVAGAGRHGIDEAEAQRLFELILKFAGYGFNKAHSTRYAIVAYQTAWFKVHHPQAFYAATLTYESGDQDKVVQYLADARRRGVEIGPPDVNTGEAQFAVDGAGVRFGLAAVKGVGTKAVEAIVQARAEGGPFADLFDFCARVDPRAVNRATIEALIRCGAFDRAGGAHRAALVAAIDAAVAAGQHKARDRDSGQLSFFDAGAAATVDVEVRFPDVPPWSREELIAAEKELLGFYVTAHPMAQYALQQRGLNWPRDFTLARLAKLPAGTPVAVCALVTGLRAVTVRTGRSAGRKMARLQLEDQYGRCSAVVFAGDYERLAPALAADAPLYLVGQVENAAERQGLILREAWPITQAVEHGCAGLLLRMDREELGAEGRLEALRGRLQRHAGNYPVRLRVEPAGERAEGFEMELGPAWRVKVTQSCVDDLCECLGPQRVALLPRPPPTRERGRAR